MASRLARELEIDPEQSRAGLLHLILRASAFLGFVVYVPSATMSIVAEVYGVAIADTVAILTVIVLYRFDRIPYRWRAGVYCAVLYLLGVALLLWVGSISQIYLFGFSILTTMLLGLRAGLGAALLSSVTLLAIGYSGHTPPEMSLPTWNADFPGWVVVTLNFTLVNTLLTLAIGAVLSALNRALHKEIASRISLRTLVDALPDIVTTKDTTGRFVSANPAALTLVGLELEEQMLGKTVHDFLPAERAEAFHRDDLRVLSGEPLWNREDRTVDRQGNPHWFLTIKVPLRDDAGSIIGLVGISRDITDRKLAQAERDRLLARLQLQIDRLPLAYVLCDAAFRYTRWNRAAERLFGFSEAEVLGKHPFDTIVPAEVQPVVAQLFDRIKAGDMEAHRQGVNRTKSGAAITCEWHNTPIFDEDGTFVGMLSLAQDITARTKLEEQLRQTQKMEAIGQLAGGVAHDFNNLLTVINGYTELLLGDAKPGDPATPMLREVHKAGTRASSLTRQLLAFSRKQVLEPKLLDLNSVVGDTEKMLRRLIGEDILLSVQLGPHVGQVKADPGQIEQIFINLAVNARDAMPRGGRLTIETQNVVLDESYCRAVDDLAPGDYVLMAISDTGVGMDEATRARIFEPFFTTKGLGQGTGLGLATVYGIAKQSRGHIAVYSELGRGTTFKVYLPRVRVPQSEPRPESRLRTMPKGTETVLIVEDEDSVRALGKHILLSCGYRVFEASDGQEALKLTEAHAEPIHLLISDVVMPNLGGRELAERLATLRPECKILFLSGYTDDAVIRHGVLEAEFAFLHKPFAPFALAQKVREVLDAPR